MEALYTKGPLAVSIDAGAAGLYWMPASAVLNSCINLIAKNLLLTSLADHTAAVMQETPASASTRPACEYQAKGSPFCLLQACSLRQTRTTCSGLSVVLR
jgi:hypothetical protein